MTFPLGLQDVVMSFNDRLLFHIPQLSLNPGEAVYLTGANGIGKTTLLKILSGLIKPTQGKVVGLSPWYQQVYGRRSQQAVYLHQSPYLFDTTVFKNIYYPIRFDSGLKRDKRAKALDAIRRVGLEHLTHEHISILSGGEKQRVAMARAWVTHPQILLMDEPSASLDQESISRLVLLAKDLLQRGTSLVITSHQQNALTELCQRQWEIKDHSVTDLPILQIIQEKQYVKSIAN